MTPDRLKAEVLRCLARVAPEADLDALAPQARLREELDLDSVDYLRFLMLLHEVSGVEVPESDYAQLATLEGCLHYLELRAPNATPFRPG